MSKIKKLFTIKDKGLKKVIIFFLTWFFVLNIVGFVGRIYLAPDSDLDLSKVFIDQWIRWDGGFFQDIAKTGYHEPPNSAFGGKLVRTAFFPLYPFLIRHLGNTFDDYQLAQRLISIVSIFLAVVFFYKLLRLDEDEDVSIKAITYFLLFPASFFFIAGYSEALFLLLLISSFYFARKSNWFLACALGGLATMTRFVGILLVIPVLYEYLVQIKFNFSKIKLDILSLLLIPFGLGIYMWYLAKTFHDPLLFIHIENSWDKKLTLNIFATFVKQFGYLLKFNLYDSQYIQTIGECLSAFFFSLFTIVAYFKLRRSYFVYALAYMLLILLMGNFGSFNRFILLVFPVFIVWAKLIKKDFYHQLMIFVSGSLLICFTIFYIIGKWSG